MSVDGATHRSGAVLFVTVVTVIGAVVGIVLGAVLGGVLYEEAGPPWAQFGYEFEGSGWALRGALYGGSSAWAGASLSLSGPGASGGSAPWREGRRPEPCSLGRPLDWGPF
jgi:hypothetical protein